MHLFKFFANKPPEDMKQSNSSFYLAVNNRRNSADAQWFFSRPLGKNEIGQFMTRAANSVWMKENVKAHSVRKTNIGRLLDAEYPEVYISELAGHKNLQSLRNYKVPSRAHQRNMSGTLSGVKRPAAAVESHGGSMKENLSPLPETSNKIVHRNENQNVALSEIMYFCLEITLTRTLI